MKTCERCGKEMERRIRRSGKLESLSEFAARRFCSIACGVRTQPAVQRLQEAHKTCERCGSVMRPKTRPAGRKEPLERFERRRFCSRKCAFQARDPLCEISRDRWQELYWGANSGYPSMLALGKRLGVAQSQIRRKLKQHGIRVRTLSEQSRIDMRRGRKACPRSPGTAEIAQAGNCPERAAMYSALMKKHKPWLKAAEILRGSTHVTRRCEWCAAEITRRAGDFKSAHAYCDRSCAGKRNSQKRHSPDALRPLFVARLMEHLKDRLPIYASLENLAAEIGATEDEIAEALLNVSDT